MDGDGEVESVPAGEWPWQASTPGQIQQGRDQTAVKLREDPRTASAKVLRWERAWYTGLDAEDR